MTSELQDYNNLLTDIKNRIRQAQIKATLSVNSEMIKMYWEIGCSINKRQHKEGWGTSVILRLVNDIRNEIPEIKGFSERNIKLMTQFYRTYPDLELIRQLPVAQISWAHNILLIQKIKQEEVRVWYMKQTIYNGWSRDTLAQMIKNNLYERQGFSINNFDDKLPSPQSELAVQLIKDPYIFDFLTISEPFHERELETDLIKHLEKFLLELGQGFAFVGRQYHLSVSDKDFYLDLLFYHLKLRCFIVIDLKKGDFKPEYAGKMNFYCSVVDDKLKHKTDQATIGLILCQTKDRILAEYSLRDIQKPIGISEYELTKALPENLKGSLPTIEELERELEN